MIQSDEQQRQLLLEIVRGKRAVTDASKLGLFISDSPEGKRLVGDLNGVVISPSIKDLIAGFLSHHNDPENLTNWAFLMLAEIGAIDLSDLECDPMGEIVLSALWEASSSGIVSEEFIENANQFLR